MEISRFAVGQDHPPKQPVQRELSSPFMNTALCIAGVALTTYLIYSYSNSALPIANAVVSNLKDKAVQCVAGSDLSACATEMSSVATEVFNSPEAINSADATNYSFSFGIKIFLIATVGLYKLYTSAKNQVTQNPEVNSGANAPKLELNALQKTQNQSNSGPIEKPIEPESTQQEKATSKPLQNPVIEMPEVPNMVFTLNFKTPVRSQDSEEPVSIPKSSQQDQVIDTPQKVVGVATPKTPVVEELARFCQHPLTPQGPIDPSALRRQILKFENQSQQFRKNKATLLKMALENVNGVLSKITTKIFADPSKYTLSPDKTPTYFDIEFTTEMLKGAQVSCTDQFYDYKEVVNHWNVWVNFANATLGGGWDDAGFVMEEMWAHSNPDFAGFLSMADHKAKTRTNSSSEGVLQGSPTPLYIEGIANSLDIPSHRNDPRGSLYGNALGNVNEEGIRKKVTKLDPPQKVNMVAIAAPRLSIGSRTQQFDPETLMDNFNTIVAGADLTKEAAKDHNLELFLHSGRLGCGAFLNNAEAIFLLHHLVSGFRGVKMKLYGYSRLEEADYLKKWELVSKDCVGKSLKDCMGVIYFHAMRR